MFDWHSGEITRATPITPTFRTTQNVRRFFQAECGQHFKFDLAFRTWLKTATGQTIGDAIDEWHRHQTKT